MPIRVLVADDEPAPRRLLEGVLAKAGYTVSAADGGQEAVALGRAHAFDIALLDVMMPDLDGVAVLQQLKALQPELIVIMVSALVSIDTAVEAMQEGAFDYIKKPFDFDQVTLTIQRALEQRQLQLDVFAAELHALEAVSADLQTAPDISRCVQDVRQALAPAFALKQIELQLAPERSGQLLGASSQTRAS